VASHVVNRGQAQLQQPHRHICAALEPQERE
jgi:hypothetical protein